MDSQIIRKVWQEFQNTVKVLRRRQLNIIKRFLRRLDEKKMREIKDWINK